METVTNPNIFNIIYGICADLEKMHNQNKDKFFYKIFKYKKTLNSYKSIYKTIDDIQRVEDPIALQGIISNYLDTIKVSGSLTGHCKSVDVTSSQVTFEYIITPAKAVVVCSNINNKVHCVFHILEKRTQLISFSIDFLDIKQIDLSEKDESSLSNLSIKAQNIFTQIIKDDMIRYLNSFVSDSEGRIKYEHGNNRGKK